jgi:hypothetical protein
MWVSKNDGMRSEIDGNRRKLRNKMKFGVKIHIFGLKLIYFQEPLSNHQGYLDVLYENFRL